MKKNYFTLDVFTSEKLKGNPLAVVTSAQGLSDGQMQKLASEFNLPETVFILPSAKPDTTCQLRIFTPKRELPFAGHPTIGAAVLLGRLKSENDNFEGDLLIEEKAGLVPVSVSYSSGKGKAEFISPGVPGKVTIASDHNKIAKAVSLDSNEIGFGNHKACFATASGNSWLFIPVNSNQSLAKAKADLSFWQEAKDGNQIVGVYLYTDECEQAEASYHARMFAPEAGIVEDPATGAAAATFPACIAYFENLSDGNYSWLLEQGYEMGRPSQIYIQSIISNSEISEVRIAGNAVLFMEGEFEI